MASSGTLIYQKAKKASIKNINKNVAKYTKTARMNNIKHFASHFASVLVIL